MFFFWWIWLIWWIDGRRMLANLDSWWMVGFQRIWPIQCYFNPSQKQTWLATGQDPSPNISGTGTEPLALAKPRLFVCFFFKWFRSTEYQLAKCLNMEHTCLDLWFCLRARFETLRRAGCDGKQQGGEGKEDGWVLSYKRGNDPFCWIHVQVCWLHIYFDCIFNPQETAT